MTLPATDSTAAPPDRFSRRAWALLLVLCGAIFLEGLDVSMLGVALPSIRAELDMSTASLQWVVSSYVLGYGGFVLLGGRAADLLGRRRMFLFWLAVFVVFSGLGGLAEEGWVLIVSRCVTGLSAGFLAPAGLSIITTSFAEGPARNRALLVYAGTAGAGFALGLVVGGLLTSLDWRWVFFAPVVLAAVILAFAVRVIPRSATAPPRHRSFDVAGAITVTVGMLLLVLGVVRAPDVGLDLTILTLTASAVALTAFVAIEHRAAAPLVRFALLRSGPLVRANLGASLFIGSFMAFQFVAVLYLQELRGWSALETGLALLVVGIDAVLAPTVTPKLIARFGTGPVILAGMILAAIGYAAFLPIAFDWSYAMMLPTFLLVGLAFSLAFGALTIAATDGVPEEDQGLAGGLLSVSIQFGAALGLAIAAAVSVAATTADSPQAVLDGYQTALVAPLALAVGGVVIAAVSLRRGAAASPGGVAAGEAP